LESPQGRLCFLHDVKAIRYVARRQPDLAANDRQTRNAGIPSYDVSGVFQDVDENRAHGRDERVGIRAFDESVEFTYRLLKTMGRLKIA